jgi:hypothetical protein
MTVVAMGVVLFPQRVGTPTEATANRWKGITRLSPLRSEVKLIFGITDISRYANGSGSGAAPMATQQPRIE